MENSNKHIQLKIRMPGANDFHRMIEFVHFAIDSNQ